MHPHLPSFPHNWIPRGFEASSAPYERQTPSSLRQAQEFKRTPGLTGTERAGDSMNKVVQPSNRGAGEATKRKQKEDLRARKEFRRTPQGKSKVVEGEQRSRGLGRRHSLPRLVSYVSLVCPPRLRRPAQPQTNSPQDIVQCLALSEARPFDRAAGAGHARDLMNQHGRCRT